MRKGSSIFTHSPKDRSCDVCRENSGEVRCPLSSTSSDTPPSPASERSDELAPGNWSRDPQKLKTRIKRWITMGLRTTVCEIFRNGWRSEQVMSKMQKCLHPDTVLRVQIRNVPRKWLQNQGRAVFTFTSQLTEIANSA